MVIPGTDCKGKVRPTPQGRPYYVDRATSCPLRGVKRGRLKLVLRGRGTLETLVVLFILFFQFYASRLLFNDPVLSFHVPDE